MCLTEQHGGYTIDQAAKALGRSKRQVERYIAAGRLGVEYVPGRYGQERRILEIPEDLLAQGQKRGEVGQFKPSEVNPDGDRRGDGPVVIDTRVVRIHWAVYVAILICFGLALAGLIAALHALDVAYWIGGG